MKTLSNRNKDNEIRDTAGAFEHVVDRNNKLKLFACETVQCSTLISQRETFFLK